MQREVKETWEGEKTKQMPDPCQMSDGGSLVNSRSAATDLSQTG